MDKVWVIRGMSSNGQEYSDYWDTDWTVAVYPTKDMADYHCDLLNKRALEIGAEEGSTTEKQTLMEAEDHNCEWGEGDDIRYYIEEAVFALHPDDFKEKAGLT